MNKVKTLQEAVTLIQDGDTIAIGGNVLHRAPMALVREIVRQKKKNLHIIKTAGAMDVDMLCFGETVSSVDAGFVSYETEFSLASHYRKAVELGKVRANEHACYTVISTLRAASMGIPFLPVKGLTTSDLIDINDYFQKINDPFTGSITTVVKAITPDVAILHVHEADEHGNAYIQGPLFEDVLISRATKRVILTTEKIVPEGRFTFSEKKAQIPHFLVDTVVKVEKGAWPCSCFPYYDINAKHISQFKELHAKEELYTYLKEYEKYDYRR